MKYFRIEHNNCFREWVVSESAEQAIDFLKKHQFHGEDFSYSNVQAIEEETDFQVHRDEVDDWPFTSESVPFTEWVQTITAPVLLHDSGDTFGNWREDVSTDRGNIMVECSSGIYDDDESWVCLVWETEQGKEWQTNAKLLVVCSTFAQARKLLQRRALSIDIHRYNYFIETRLFDTLN